MKKMLIALVMVSLAACGGKGDGGEGGLDLDPGQQFAYDGAKEDLVKVKAAIKAGKAEDVNFTCAAVQGYVETLKTVEVKEVKDLVSESKQVCGYEMPYAIAKVAADKMTEALKKDPEAIMISECMNLGMNVDAMKEAGFGDKKEVAELAALAKKHCE